MDKIFKTEVNEQTRCLSMFLPAGLENAFEDKYEACSCNPHTGNLDLPSCSASSSKNWDLQYLSIEIDELRALNFQLNILKTLGVKDLEMGSFMRFQTKLDDMAHSLSSPQYEDQLEEYTKTLHKVSNIELATCSLEIHKRIEKETLLELIRISRENMIDKLADLRIDLSNSTVDHVQGRLVELIQLKWKQLRMKQGHDDSGSD